MHDARDIEARYGLAMQKVGAPSELKRRVLDAARDTRLEQGSEVVVEASPNRPFSNEGKREAQRPERIVSRTGARKRRHGAVLGGCAAALAAALALALVVPSLVPATVQDGGSPFVVKAYGGVEDPLLPNGREGGRVVFNCETETQRYVPEAEYYVNEGCYTGCLFTVQGEGIVRVQADVSRGELYRMEGVEYTARSNPELAQAIAAWKPLRIGEDGLLGKYDLVKHVMHYEAVEEGDANDGRLRGDPDTALKANLYQRLGRTIDVAVEDEPAIALTERTFGLWTNEPFDRAYDSLAMGMSSVDLDRALDTLDGATLTVTATFEDGSWATQVIRLHAANFKTVSRSTLDGQGVVTELTLEMLADGTRAEQGTADDAPPAGIHTLYGTVERVSAEPFPCGEASHPSLDKPLTAPEGVPDAGIEVAAYDPGPYDGHAYSAIGAGDVLGLGATWHSPMTASADEVNAWWRY